MMIELGSFRNTTVLAVTGETDIFTSPGPYSSYVVHANRNVLLVRNNVVIVTDDDDNPPNAFPLKEGEYARIRLDKNEVLSFVLAAGETDGTIWLTEAN